jgi:ATP-dependent protease ClpP protease subunit
MDSALMDAQLQQLKSLNQMVIRVVSETAKKKDAEIQAAVHSQAILSPDQAKMWGIVQDVRDSFSVPSGFRK